MKITRGEIRCAIRDILLEAAQLPDVDYGTGREGDSSSGEAEEDEEEKSSEKQPEYHGSGVCPYPDVYAESDDDVKAGDPVPESDSLTPEDLLDRSSSGPMRGSGPTSKSGKKIKSDPRCENLKKRPVENAEEFSDIFMSMAQTLLGVASIFDPTPVSDSLSIALYVSDGDYDSAAVVAAASLGGLGAGALGAKIYKRSQLYGLHRASTKHALKKGGWPEQVADDASKRVMNLAAKKGKVPRSRAKIQDEAIEAAAKASARAKVKIGARVADLNFASSKILKDDTGRLFTAMKMPGGEVKIFYRSTGSSMRRAGAGSGVKEGDWVVTQGIVLQPGPSFQYLKAPGKANVAGSPEEKVAAGLKDLYNTGKMRSTHSFSPGKAKELTRKDVEDVARFNRWVYNKMGKVPDDIAKTETPFIGVTISAGDAWKQIQLTQKLAGVLK